MTFSLTDKSNPYYHISAMHKYILTPQASEAISYVISNAIESGGSDSWFLFRKYKHRDLEDGHFYAEAEAKMTDECDAPWHDGKWVQLTPQSVADRINDILADDSHKVHTQVFWNDTKGYLAHEMRNLMMGEYGDGDATRDDGILQVLFCGEVICS
jgi:hypothetical protein